MTPLRFLAEFAGFCGLMACAALLPTLAALLLNIPAH